VSVKLSRYVFRRIKGRIVPIRSNVKLASPEISAAAESVTPKGFRHTAKGLKKLGKGVDFDVFSIKGSDQVLKIPASNPSRAIKSKKLIEAIPGIDDKVARAQAIGANLPNFDVPTVESFSVRLTRKLKALVQPHVDVGTVRTTKNPKGMTTMEAARNIERARLSANWISFKSGLSIDAHAGNITHRGELVDTALGKLPSNRTITRPVAQRMRGSRTVVAHSDPVTAKELLDGGHIGFAPKDFKKATVISERAAAEGSSAKIMRAFKSLRKKGYTLEPIGKSSKDFSLTPPKNPLRGRKKP
jgi:hypothetical protein